jgi:hypothetical protein
MVEAACHRSQIQSDEHYGSWSEMVLVLQASLMTVAQGLERTAASGPSAAADYVARVSAKRILH